MRCVDCERIDDILFDETQFWFYFGTEDAFSRVAVLCGARGLTARQFNSRGITVSDAMVTSDPDILAVGECVEHRGQLFGLVAPLYDQAQTCDV